MATGSVHLDHATMEFIKAVDKQPPLYKLEPEQGRAALSELQSGPVDLPPADIENLSVPGGPTGTLSLTIIRPQNASAPLPVLVYVHGAGWVFGDLKTHERLVRELAIGTGAAVVFCNYSRSPEAKYPTAIEEIYATTRWVAEHGPQRGLDADRMAIAGDSVGGAMATAVTMLAKERGGPALRCQVLFYPVTDASFDTESYKDFATGFYLTREAMEWFWDQYTETPAQRLQPTAAPLRATTEQLAGLPTALVITGEADVLRDEGEAYANKLRDAGVRSTEARFQGIIHDFVMLNSLADTAAAHGAINLAVQTLQEAYNHQG